MYLQVSGFHHDTQPGYLRATAAKDLSMQFFEPLKSQYSRGASPKVP
jgi:hypothetical protein